MAIGIADILTGLMGAGSIMQTVSAYKGAEQDKAAYKYQSVVDSNNSQIAQEQSADAIRNGQVEAMTAGLRTAQLEGRQRNMYAGANIDASQGSPLNVLSDTLFLGRRDAGIIMDNANKKAWGYKVQAQNYKDNAGLLNDRADATDPWKAGLSTLLTTGGTVAAKWYSMDKSQNYQTLGG